MVEIDKTLEIKILGGHDEFGFGYEKVKIIKDGRVIYSTEKWNDDNHATAMWVAEQITKIIEILKKEFANDSEWIMEQALHGVS